MAQGVKRVNVNVVVSLNPTRGNGIFYYFYILGLLTGVELRHSACNAFRIRRKMRTRSVLMGTECLNTRLPASLLFAVSGRLPRGSGSNPATFIFYIFSIKVSLSLEIEGI